MNWFRRLFHRLLELLGLRRAATPPTPTTAQASSADQHGLVEPELDLGTSDPPKYKMWDSVLSYRERVFYRALLEDVSDEYQVFAKVRMGDIIKLANEPANRKYHSNQLQCKHLDFIVCVKGSLQPLLAIELDDSSHNKYDRQTSDEFKDRVCNDAGLRLWRLTVQPSYPKGTIGAKVRSEIHAGFEH